MFDKLSPKTDFISKTTTTLQIINQNLLYLTHEMDKVHKIVKTLLVDKDLQNTVDKYFERDETSPQTEQVEQ